MLPTKKINQAYSFCIFLGRRQFIFHCRYYTIAASISQQIKEVISLEMSDGIKGNAKIKILPLILIFFKPLRKMYEKKMTEKLGYYE